MAEDAVLGSKAAVVAVITKHCPNVQFDDDKSFGVYDAGGSQIEFLISYEDPVTAIMLELYGNGQLDKRLNAICKDAGWEVIDVASGKFLEFNGHRWE